MEFLNTFKLWKKFHPTRESENGDLIPREIILMLEFFIIFVWIWQPIGENGKAHFATVLSAILLLIVFGSSWFYKSTISGNINSFIAFVWYYFKSPINVKKLLNLEDSFKILKNLERETIILESMNVDDENITEHIEFAKKSLKESQNKFFENYDTFIKDCPVFYFGKNITEPEKRALKLISKNGIKETNENFLTILKEKLEPMLFDRLNWERIIIYTNEREPYYSPGFRSNIYKEMRLS